MTFWQAFAIVLVAWLPGALVFRLPFGSHARRAGLAAEERVFWSVVLSAAVSSVVVLGLAAGGWYRFERLLWVNGSLALLIVAAFRGRLRPGGVAPVTWTALLPLALVLLAAWVYFRVPPAEYVMGGKDPGVYMNEGIQIAQRGSLSIADGTVAAVPPLYRDLFFPDRRADSYYSNRFMGFFLLDPDTGLVTGQFTHLYPAWIAIGYGVHGLTGARSVLAFWAILGVLAVYFLGARLFGRPAAFAGAGLLAVHVLQVWYARYPNAEMVMQPLVWAGLLAYTRAHRDEDAFFAPVAGVLLGLTIVAHLTGVFVVGAVAGAAVLGRFGAQPVRAGFALPLAVTAAIALAYLATYLAPYFAVPRDFLAWRSRLELAALASLGVAGAVSWWLAGRARPAQYVRAGLPAALVCGIWALAAYAYFVRVPEGRLAPQDADALRTFAAFYVSPYGLAAALAGLALAARRSFWASLPLLIVVGLFSCIFFYKIRIIPEHFWAGRRLLAVVLPGALLLAATAATAALAGAPWRGATGGAGTRGLRALGGLAGLAFVALLGWQYVTATQAILRHVEYAGLVARLERLAATVGDDDLLVVESRGASDTHVLALPLAYIYNRHVLVLWSPAPDRSAFRGFLSWAQTRYRRVFFAGGGGTELLSRTTAVEAVGGERFQIPEYQSAWDTYPRRVTFKEFDFGLYEFLDGDRPAGSFDLDVGVADDLYVRRFHAKEQRPSGATFRWTRDASYVSIVGAAGDCHRLTLWLGHGGRPAHAPPPAVRIVLNDVPLGEFTVSDGFEPHSLHVPRDLAASMALEDDAARLLIESRTWNPHRLLGAGDGRDLGVMLDRLTLECGPDNG